MTDRQSQIISFINVLNNMSSTEYSKKAEAVAGKRKTMDRISDGFIDKLKAFCDNEQLLMWQSLKKRLKTAEKNRIANTGLVSSGKSSLFNTLLNSVDEERFPTGASRKTLIEDEELFTDNIFLVDTPGIDVREEDDEKAFKAVMSSDIILVVHNIKLGALQREEYNWIKKICSTMASREEIAARLVVAVSWIDERDKEEDYQAAIDETKEMLFEICNMEVEMFCVSAKRYLTGLKKQNQVLIEKSNIPALRERLIEKAKEYSEKKQCLMDEELANIAELTEETLLERRAVLMKHVKAVEERVSKGFLSRTKTWNSLMRNLRQKLKRVESLKSEYRNI
ncbi:MAG TPA: GTPase [Clostridia bacterium]|nr:GTPase [Clostridia bacterium]